MSTEQFTVTVNLLDLEPLDKDTLIRAIQETRTENNNVNN